MKKTNKKGFTIVELVIVIAVIAILAAVLVPNISRLVKKANESSDLSLVRNLNTALAVENTTYATAYEAFEAVKEAGYDLTKIEAKASDNKILFDSANQCFVYLNNNKLEYYPNSQKTALTSDEYYKLWAIETEAKTDGAYTYSVYWNGEANADITVKGVGFDAGEKTVKSVTYTGASEAHIVTIRTNSFDTTLTIDAENDTVYHYEQVGSVDIVKVASASYHENGVVKGNIVVAQGRVEVAEKADIKGTVLVTGNNVKVDLPEKSTTEVAINDGVTGAEVKGTIAKKAAMVNYVDLSYKIGKAGIDIVYLREDTTLEKTLSISASAKKSSCVLDLNGRTLTVATQIKIARFNLTIQGEGKIIYEGTKDMFDINTNSTATVETKLTINGGEYIATNGGIFANASDYADKNNKRPALIINDGIFTAKEEVVLAYNGSSVEINGGVFTSKDNAVLMSNGSTVNGGAVWTINGGVFNGYIESTGSIACGLYMANTDKVTINGGTFNITNGVAILARSGNATIGKDVVINLYNENGGIVSGKVGDSTVKISAATAIVMDKQSGYPGGDPTVTNESNYLTYDNSTATAE